MCKWKLVDRSFHVDHFMYTSSSTVSERYAVGRCSFRSCRQSQQYITGLCNIQYNTIRLGKDEHYGVLGKLTNNTSSGKISVFRYFHTDMYKDNIIYRFIKYGLSLNAMTDSCTAPTSKVPGRLIMGPTSE